MPMEMFQTFGPVGKKTDCQVAWKVVDVSKFSFGFPFCIFCKKKHCFNVLGKIQLYSVQYFAFAYHDSWSSDLNNYLMLMYLCLVEIFYVEIMWYEGFSIF